MRPILFVIAILIVSLCHLSIAHADPVAPGLCTENMGDRFFYDACYNLILGADRNEDCSICLTYCTTVCEALCSNSSGVEEKKVSGEEYQACFAGCRGADVACRAKITYH